jgi:DnaJ domain
VAKQQPDYYSLLDIGRSATAKEIGRAYRRAARATHPDIHPDDTSATERFNAITSAYETLSDPQRRASYDRTPPRRSVHIAVQQPFPVAPVHLGARRNRPERVQPLHANRASTPGAANLFELVAALSRLIDRWPFP